MTGDRRPVSRNQVKLDRFASAEERFCEYRRQNKILPRNAKAREWLNVLDSDPEIARFVGAKHHINRTRRNRKWNQRRRL